jgi:hypothetical protein
MVKDVLQDLMDKKLAGEASENELLELRDLLIWLMPEEPIAKEQITRAYMRMVRRMREMGIPFGK